MNQYDKNPLDQASGVPLWTVTRVSDTTSFDPRTGSQQAKRIDFSVQGGISSYVIVPLSDFTRDNVGRLIHEAVQHLLDVHSLQGPIMPPEAFTGGPVPPSYG